MSSIDQSLTLSSPMLTTLFDQKTTLGVILAAFIKGSVIMGVLLGITGWIVLFERKVISWLQHRVGPNRAGPAGLLQPLADVLKLLSKEDTLPPFADKALFIAAPAIIAITGLLGFVIIPFGDPLASHWYVISQTNMGVLFFLGLSSLGVYSIVLAGFSSNSKYAMIGGLRATAQMISYELSMGMALLSVVMMVGSFNLADIVRAQSPWWFILLNPLGFIIFLISTFAESRRTPFDLPEAENELVAGFHTEYSSMKFALFFLGEYMAVLLLSCVIAIMFLGGWYAPPLWGWVWLVLKVGTILWFVKSWGKALLMSARRRKTPIETLLVVGFAVTGLLIIAALVALNFINGWFGPWPGPVMMVLKVAFLTFFFIWIRATYPRYRYDKLMDIGWKWLIPLSILNLVIIALLVLTFPGLVPMAQR